MKKSLCILIYMILFQACVVSYLKAEVYESLVDFNEEIAQAWISVANKEDIQHVVAEALKTEKGYLVRADVGVIVDETLISAVILDRNGNIISTPLHNPKNSELEKESKKIAQRKIPTLAAELKEASDRLKTLEGDMKLTNIRKRKEFGFDEIDLIYERITAIQEEIDRINQ